MRNHPRSGWLILTVALALGLGLVPPLAVPAGATGGVIASPLPGDMDGDGVPDGDDDCITTPGTTDDTDGFAGCKPIEQIVWQALNDGQVSGQVNPREKWLEQDVCRTGIEVTLRARWYTDHDPTTMEGALTERVTSDANGRFDFEADLPFGTEYYVDVYPRAVVGDEVYCASARTEVDRYVENVGREVAASYKSVTGRVTGRVVVPGDTHVEEPCSDLQTATLLQRFDDKPSEEIGSSTFLGADETFSIDAGRLVDGAHYVVEIAERGPEGFPDLCREARTDVTEMADQDDDDVADASDACRAVAGDKPTGCPTVTRSVSASYRAGQLAGKVSVASLGGAPAGSCSGSAQLQVWQLEQGGAWRELGQPESSVADGSYVITRPLEVGTTVRVQALAGEDTGRALCGAADSPMVTATDQRPVVQRTVVATYALGKVSGTARPVGAGVPAGACTGAPVAVSYAGADGQLRFDGSVGANGAFELGVGRPAVGTTLTVTLGAYDDDVAVCPAVQPSPSVTVLGDRDEDGVPDTADDCPGVAGPPRLLESGCPVVQRRMVTSYADGVLSGSVELVDPEASPPGACSARSFVQVSSFEGDEFKDNLWSGWTDADGTFAAPVGRLAHDTGYYAFADPYLDPGAGICQTADESRVFRDRDGDSFGDDVDACPDHEGPAVGMPGFSEAFRGCRLVDTEVSAAYADRAVSGRVRLADPEHAPAGACAAAAQVRVTRLAEGELESGELGRGETTASGGTYSIPVGHLPIGTRLRVTAYFPQAVVDQISACGQSRSEIVEITDGDGDAVADYLDECPGVPAGQGPTLRPGCPTLARQVSATYADGAVTGDAVPVGSANAPAGACAPAEVDVYRIDPDGRPATLLASDATDTKGAFHIVLDEPLEGGSRFQVVAASFSDRDLADCALATSAEVEVAWADQDGDGVPDRDDLCDLVPASQGYLGCPKVDLSVTSRYEASGAVTGRVRLINPQVAPGACLQATVEVLRVGTDGVPRTIGSRVTEPDGSYHILPAQPLVGGDVYFALISSRLDRELAFCAGGQSGARVAPTPQITG